MKLWCLLLICLGGAVSAAAAQTAARPPASAPPSLSGAASVRTHLEALHYKDVRDLRRGLDGRWTGTATQGNVGKTVTVAPDGTVTAR